MDATQHGTVRRYWRGCRCDECRTASSEYARLRSGATKMSRSGHGTVANYGRGCRCDECKAAKGEYLRKWREANIDRERERERRWREANREKLREISRKWYEANPDKERERQRQRREANPDYHREWYEANRDKVLEYQRKYHEANAAKIRERVRKWQEANPDRTRDGKRKAAQIRRARKFDAFVEPVDSVTVYGRNGWTCHICGELIDPELRFPDPLSASLDHIIPLAKGGEHSYDNCATSHLGCNVRKSAKMPA